MSATANRAPRVGSFGDYELGFKLATGGMAEIFVARRKRPADGEDPLVVIKRILPHLADEERFVRMFRDEARLARLLKHENICDIYEFGEVGETYYLAMEYLHGVPFSALMKHSAKTQAFADVPLTIGILQQACLGLHYAHEQHGDDGAPLNLVHRDLSPPNILITESGVVKVLDFGVAKARGAADKTRTGTIKGKNSYMSPEQVRGKVVDRRSDVFALGILLFEAMTTRRLFKAASDFLVFQMITENDIPDVKVLRPDLAPDLVAVIYRALSQDREDRFASVKELSLALEAATTSYGPPATREQIAAFLQEGFGGELDALQGRTQAVLTARGPETPVPAPIPAAASTDAPAVEAVPIVDAPMTETRRRKLPLLWIALGAAALVVLVIGLALLLGDDEDDEPKVVVGGRDASMLTGHIQTSPTPTTDAPTQPTDAGVADARPPDGAVRDASALDAATVVATTVTDGGAGTTNARVVKRIVKQRPKRGPPGYLSIDSRPYATIYVDGRKRGVTPLHRLKLPSGKRRVRAVSSAGTKRFILRIRSGKLTTKRLSNW